MIFLVSAVLAAFVYGLYLMVIVVLWAIGILCVSVGILVLFLTELVENWLENREKAKKFKLFPQPDSKYKYYRNLYIKNWN